MKKQVVFFGQNPDGDDTTSYEIFVKARGAKAEIEKLKSDLEKKLFSTEIKDNSLVAKFIGEFQKGIDYIGDMVEFENHFKIHCEIAREYGNYKISVHSGSDKFKVYPIIGKYTQKFSKSV